MRAPRIQPVEHRWEMRDGYEISGRVFHPRLTPSRPCVIYLHGIQSHGGWYEWSASLLAERGHIVIVPDRRGSGTNSVDRGDARDANRWLQDLEEVAERATQDWPIDRFALMSVSWGAKLALLWADQQPQRFRELLFVAPGVMPRVGVSLLTKLQIAGALVFAATHRFEIPLSDPALFTDNPEGQEFIRHDPLKLTHATARMLYASRVLDQRIARLAPLSESLSATLLLAGRDRIIDNYATQRRFAQLFHANLQHETLMQSGHTLEFDDDVTAFKHALMRWSEATSG